MDYKLLEVTLSTAESKQNQFPVTFIEGLHHGEVRTPEVETIIAVHLLCWKKEIHTQHKPGSCFIPPQRILKQNHLMISLLL